MIRNLDTILQNLYELGGISKPIFSICLASNNGYFSVGGVNTTHHLQEISYIPYYDRNFYRVKLMDIKLNNDDIQINDSQYYTIIDSGTTISYFPKSLYSQIEKLINIYCSQIDKCLGDMYNDSIGMCFKVKPKVTEKKFIESLPEFTFLFEKGVKYQWKPENYIYNNTENDKKLNFCIGISSWGSNEILLGTTWMHNHDIIFDNVNRRIGLVSSSCDMSYSSKKDNSSEDEETTTTSPTKPVENQDTKCEPNYDFYVTIILMLSILIVMLFVILILACFRIRRGQNFLWMRLQNEENGSGLEHKNTGNSNNRIEMNINKNMQGIKSKNDFRNI